MGKKEDDLLVASVVGVTQESESLSGTAQAVPESADQGPALSPEALQRLATVEERIGGDGCVNPNLTDTPLKLERHGVSGSSQ